MDPKIIANNILKDLYHARISVGFFVTLQLIRFFFVSNPLAGIAPGLKFTLIDGDLRNAIAVSTYFAMIATTLVVISGWIHSDSVRDGDAFWVTRPAREKHLFVSKLACVVLVFLVVPMFLDVIVGLAYGAGWNVLWTIPNTLWVHGLLTLVLLFVASATPDLARMILYLLPIPFAMTLWIGFVMTSSKKAFWLYMNPDFEIWIKVILGGGLLFAYVNQSIRRKRGLSLKIAFIAFFIAPLLALPRFSDPRDAVYDNATELTGVSLEPASYLHSRSRGERDRAVLKIGLNYSVNDTGPNRILVFLKNRVELTTEKGARQEHQIKFESGQWSSEPFFRVLRNAGYDIAKTMPTDVDQTILAPLLKFKMDNELREFANPTSLELNSWFAEYHVVSISSLPLSKYETLAESGIRSSIVNNFYRRKKNEKGSDLGMRELEVLVKLQETRFVNGFNSLRYTPEKEVLKSGNRRRLYFLYDPVNKCMVANSRSHSRSSFEEGMPFHGSSIRKQNFFQSFKIQYGDDSAIDRKQLRLVAVDIEKTGIQVLSSLFTVDRISDQIEAIRNDPMSQGSGIEKWEKEIPLQ